jgi:hypothetical protein
LLIAAETKNNSRFVGLTKKQMKQVDPQMNCYSYEDSKDLNATDFLADIEFEYEEALDIMNSSGHTDATTMTAMSEDPDDQDIGRMLEDENFPDHFIDTESYFDPPLFLPASTAPTSTSRNSSRAWSTFSGLRNASLGSLFGNSIGSPSISSTEAPPSLKSISCSSASYNTESGTFCHYQDPFGCELTKKSAVAPPAPPPPPPVPKPVPFRLRHRSSSSSSRGSSRGRRPKRKDRSQRMPVKEESSPGLVGDLAFKNMHVSPPSSPTPKKGKLVASPKQSPLSKMKRGILCMKNMAVGTPKNKQPEPKQVTPKLKKSATRSKKNNKKPVIASIKNTTSPQKKRTRRKEPLKKQHFSITDADVLLGRGGMSNHHPGNKTYRKHILTHQQEYKNLENTSAKTKMSKEMVEWVKARGGRFLKRDDGVEGNPFYVATDTTARQKVSQALREDHTPEGRKLKRSRTKKKPSKSS